MTSFYPFLSWKDPERKTLKVKRYRYGNLERNQNNWSYLWLICKICHRFLILNFHFTVFLIVGVLLCKIIFKDKFKCLFNWGWDTHWCWMTRKIRKEVFKRIWWWQDGWSEKVLLCSWRISLYVGKRGHWHKTTWIHRWHSIQGLFIMSKTFCNLTGCVMPF